MLLDCEFNIFGFSPMCWYVDFEMGGIQSGELVCIVEDGFFNQAGGSGLESSVLSGCSVLVTSCLRLEE